VRQTSSLCHPDLRQYPIALLDGLAQDCCRHRHRARHERSIALAAIPPVRGMSRLDHHFRAAQAYSRATARFARRGLAATTRGLRLEHAPAIVAGMDAKIRFPQYEVDVVAPNLLAGTSPETSIARGDPFAQSNKPNAQNSHSSKQNTSHYEPTPLQYLPPLLTGRSP